jgi:hypothetical protein
MTSKDKINNSDKIGIILPRLMASHLWQVAYSENANLIVLCHYPLNPKNSIIIRLLIG